MRFRTDQEILDGNRLALNDFHMASHNSCVRKNVAIHEQGQAIGLAHSYGNNIMKSGSTQCVLGSHDIDDYEELWGES